MLLTPQKGRQKVISNLGIVGAELGTGITSNATTLLDGAVTELISAAANIQDSWGIFINILDTGNITTISHACMDILIGGATDDVLIAALICGHTFDTRGNNIPYFFPIHIPQGKRIAATYASVRTSSTARIGVSLIGGGIPPFRVGRKVTTYGTQISNARGQAVVPALSGAAASVTEMTASTSEDHFAFMPGFQPENDSSLLSTSINIGIGVGASTEDRIGTWHYETGQDETIGGPMPAFPAFCDVPAGSRLTMLASNLSASNDTYGGLIYAVS